MSVVFPRVCSAGLREGDELWMVNTRCISSNVCNADLANPSLRVYRYYPKVGFRPDTMDNLLINAGQDVQRVNVIYVHGNRIKAEEAIERVWQVYSKVRCQQDPRVMVRWILWSWPSDPLFNPITDVRAKAPKADAQALYTGWFLQRFTATDRLQIIGYSFGGRIATGCLHAAAGGEICGRSIAGPSLVGARIGVNLVAPAMDRKWLINGAAHGMAVENMGHLNLFYNNRDRVLRLYSLVTKYYNPVALGFAGLQNLGTRSDGLPIEILSKNCSSAVGLMHNELKYYEPCCSAAKTIARSLDASSPLLHTPIEQPELMLISPAAN